MMQKILLIYIIVLSAFAANAQVSNFDSFFTEPNQSILNNPAGFIDGIALFPNEWNDNYGGFWSGQWAMSSVQDTTDGTFMNLVGAQTFTGSSGSLGYAVGQQNARIYPVDGTFESLRGAFFTNSTYAHFVIKEGNTFAEPFGGEDGTTPDYFSLTIKSYYNGELKEDSVEFFLADYRFEDSSEDYIVDTWEWVDFSILEPADSLEFILNSTGVNNYGISTPLFFCMDDFNKDFVSTNERQLARIDLNVYPNPTTGFLSLNLQEFDNQEVELSVFDANAQVVLVEQVTANATQTIDLSHLPSGQYVVKVVSQEGLAIQKIIKQ